MNLYRKEVYQGESREFSEHALKLINDVNRRPTVTMGECGMCILQPSGNEGRDVALNFVSCQNTHPTAPSLVMGKVMLHNCSKSTES